MEPSIENPQQAVFGDERMFVVYLWSGAPVGRLCGGGLAGGELEEQRRVLDAERAKDLLLLGCEFGPLSAVAGGSGERAEVHALESVAEVAPGVAGVVLGDPD